VLHQGAPFVVTLLEWLHHSPAPGAWRVTQDGQRSTREVAYTFCRLLVRRMGIGDRREWRRVSCEPLRQEEVLCRPVDVGHCRVPQRMEVVWAIEPGLLLPPSEPPLGGMGRGAATLSGAKQRRVGIGALTVLALP